MRIFVNRKAVKGPWGGENSFMGALCRWLTDQGHCIVTDREGDVDIALLNALTLIDLDFVKQLHARNVPIIHRKVGFVVSGSPEIRAVHDGVVEGDRRQIEFSPFIKHTVFQSEYSKNAFMDQGFEGDYTVIHNGVDQARFNTQNKKLFGFVKEERAYWDKKEPFKIIMSTWSSDLNKGFEKYKKVHDEMGDDPNFSFTFVGRKPDGFDFPKFKNLPPQPHKKLAQLYREHHALLFLARLETCSNSIIEAINCGLPVIYEPSGGNPETAGEYGIEFNGDIRQCISSVQKDYDTLVEKTLSNSYNIEEVGPKYLSILNDVLSKHQAA